MWWNVPSVVCCGKTSAAYKGHFGLNGHNRRSLGGNTSKCRAAREPPFVIRQITGHQLTALSSGQVLITCLRLRIRATVCTCCGGFVVVFQATLCWKARQARPSGSGQRPGHDRVRAAAVWPKRQRLGCGWHASPNALRRPHPLRLCPSPSVPPAAGFVYLWHTILPVLFCPPPHPSSTAPLLKAGWGTVLLF